MILEAVEHLTTPCPRWARSLGYLGEAIAIRHRARRCRAAWAPHQEKTKAAILAHCPERCGEIVVLGAGLCLDVPVEALSARADRLTLVDAVRLRGLRLPANTRYLCRDIHGLADALHAGTPMDVRPDPLADFRTASAVLSVNLISQLPILPVRAMRGRAPLGFEAALAGRMMRDHVADLMSHRGRAILIGDARRRHYGPGGRLADAVSVQTQASLPDPRQSWTWSVIPPGELSDGMTVETTVGVWVF